MSATETWRGRRCGRPDACTLSNGVVLYELATGQQAFRGTTTAVVFDGILNRTPEAPSHLNAAVPAEFEGITARAIEKSREYRYQSADELARDLQHLLRQTDPDGAPAAFDAPPPSGRSRRVFGWNTLARPQRWRRWPVVAGAAAVIAAGAVSLWPTPRAEALNTGDVILVSDFLNSTGDPVFDGTLKQALEVKLGESAVLNVMPEQRVRETLGYMRRSPDAVVTAALGREICQREGATALMTGEIARLGASYVITLTAETCASGDVLSREQVEVPRKLGAMAAIASLGLRPLALASFPWRSNSRKTSMVACNSTLSRRVPRAPESRGSRQARPASRVC